MLIILIRIRLNSLRHFVLALITTHKVFSHLLLFFNQLCDYMRLTMDFFHNFKDSQGVNIFL